MSTCSRLPYSSRSVPSSPATNACGGYTPADAMAQLEAAATAAAAAREVFVQQKSAELVERVEAGLPGAVKAHKGYVLESCPESNSPASAVAVAIAQRATQVLKNCGWNATIQDANSTMQVLVHLPTLPQP